MYEEYHKPLPEILTGLNSKYLGKRVNIDCNKVQYFGFIEKRTCQLFDNDASHLSFGKTLGGEYNYFCRR